ncbi:salicylate hydroxylase [Russula earlei]|uniref:Salicylate hydroxylase n=1 Tax=Russula earlei TaxID=71964 RepID=A0ACC0U6N9_9AGAM|nr:salicylate hydroxylase [Russula earlei]
MSEPPSKFHVAICGGGVGGLTLAFALSKSPNIRVDVYEAASKFSEIGAGIGVWWRTRQVLKSLGLEEDVIRLLSFRPGQDRVPTIQYRKADQLQGRAMGPMYSRGGVMGLHRAEFHEALLNRLSSRCRTFTSKRLKSYHQRPGTAILLRFHDGSTATCDILIGADGLKSVVRKKMFHEAALWAESQRRNADAAELRSLSELRFSGALSYRTLIPAARLSSVSPQHRVFSSAVQYLGKNMHVMAYPVSRGRFINFVVFEIRPHEEGTQFSGPWVADVDPSYIVSLFHGWEREVRELIQCLGGLKITRWAVNILPALPFFAFGNVAIMGDAVSILPLSEAYPTSDHELTQAHAMAPFQGAGAGQAIEDASMLASLLSHELTTGTTAAHVLGIYSRVRQPLSAEVARRSRLNGDYFALRGLGPDVDGARLQGILKQIQDNFEWVSETEASSDLERAIELLQAELAA